ncbi:hypothetical protein [Thiohalocapsa sp. ML1]|uniref:hypothetical protein n=1 Tax=Thiohalocapsa sp. ML1 TaxID=1431688 RepID=UPI001C1FEAB9|nr:hypothetical protein [Thiohalocapsa sp. ML1]
MNISLLEFVAGIGASIVATFAVATVVVVWKPLRFQVLLSRYRSLLSEHASFQDPLGTGLEYYPYHTLEFDQVTKPAKPLALVTGDAGVGKTCFLKHLLHNQAFMSRSRLGLVSSTPIILDENVVRSAGTGTPHARFHRLVRNALSNCAPFFYLDIDKLKFPGFAAC